ncbi:transglutaminase family protein [Phaeobacter marinintestinus]|uniref:transglutaminase family protein n=1 Tax=Falsiphaeobacter marinintestinus TaxID=1492905 RepID=UPI0011B7AF71|nr:transglutaminase family protein [Phaeobacter marinintestinus]
MRLKISHTTSYHYDAPVPYALQQLRLRPKSRAEQTVLSWDLSVENGHQQLSFEDEHANTVDLISFEPGVSNITVHCEGEVEVTDTNGVVGKHSGYVPLWLFKRATPLTRAGSQLRALAASLERTENDLSDLHALSALVLERLPYSTQQESAELSAEQALNVGHGVCQDHAHVFIAAARHLDFPARYVSGYLMMNDRVDQDASHAWAEVHVDGLGWVGFDISNAMSPDARYVRVATALDYHGAAPVSGMRFGAASEALNVKLQVEQRQE